MCFSCDTWNPPNHDILSTGCSSAGWEIGNSAVKISSRVKRKARPPDYRCVALINGHFKAPVTVEDISQMKLFDASVDITSFLSSS